MGEEFMKKMSKIDTDSLKSRNIFYSNGTTTHGIPVLYYIANRLHQDIDSEKLIFFILKTMQPFIQKKYSLVIDLTNFSNQNSIGNQWIAQISKIIPSEVYDNLD